MSKAIAFGYIWKVSVANVNASHSQGNVIVAKQITLPDGSTRPYISGQAIRRMVRDRWADCGWPLAEEKATVSGQEVKPPLEPWKFIDEDLFGYLDASGGRRRVSPVRVTAAVGQFPYQGDRDLGTRSFQHFGAQMAEGGNMFETEVYANVFRGALLVELDRIGRWPLAELSKGAEELAKVLEPRVYQLHQEDQQSGWVEASSEEKSRRLKALFAALRSLWGGGRTARLLVDLSPIAFFYARLQVKQPLFVELPEVRYGAAGLSIDLVSLREALALADGALERVIVGLSSAHVCNADGLRAGLNERATVASLPQAWQQLERDLEQLWKGTC